MTTSDLTILKQAGVTQDSKLHGAVDTRGNILEMSQVAENAVLRPKETGAFTHDLRAALAARIARLGGDNALAKHYAANAGGYASVADPKETGSSMGLNPVLTFVDQVANRPKDITAEDLAHLKSAAVSDADIVRLCELVAFLAFQLRVIAGLRLMEEHTS